MHAHPQIDRSPLLLAHRPLRYLTIFFFFLFPCRKRLVSASNVPRSEQPADFLRIADAALPMGFLHRREVTELGYCTLPGHGMPAEGCPRLDAGLRRVPVFVEMRV